MTNCLITLKSQTYAMKAQMIITKSGIPVRSVKLDGDYTKRGCTHGIRFDCRYKASVQKLLRDNGVSYSDIKNV